MIRKHLTERRSGAEADFRWRGQEVTRLEGITDAVFAFAVTLLVEHYCFFRRYGLENLWAVTLNCALLFFVLFYVYPLKFLFSSMFSQQQFPVPNMRVLFMAWPLPETWVGLAGYVYFTVGAYFTYAGSFWGRRERELRTADANDTPHHP